MSHQVVTENHLRRLRDHGIAINLPEFEKRVRKAFIESALHSSKGHIGSAGKLLGIKRTTLNMQIIAMGIERKPK